MAHYHMLLDPINLVTCLYRLAKMSKEASKGRGGYLAELQRSTTFQLLLREYMSPASRVCCPCAMPCLRHVCCHDSLCR